MLSLASISKSYKNNNVVTDVFKDVSLSVAAGASLAVTGPSGCGKSTLLHIAGLLMRPDEGEVLIEGKALEGASDAARTKIRKEKLGFIYQFHHLLADMTAKENVMIPLLLNGKSRAKAAGEAQASLENVGLRERSHHYPAQLSGGECQRVAIARALVHRPKLIIADEPTGNLDPETAAAISHLLFEQCRQYQAALLMVTHNMQLAAMADASFAMVASRNA